MCELLKIKEKLPFTLPTPVEPALEANEANEGALKRQNVDKKIKSNERIRPKPDQQTLDEGTPKLVRVPAGSLPPLQLSPSKQIKSNGNNKYKMYNVDIQRDDFEYVGKIDTEVNSNAKVRYEIPESSLSRTATLILGNRKELEMHEFSYSKLGNDPNIGENSGRRIPTMPEIDPSGDRQQPIE